MNEDEDIQISDEVLDETFLSVADEYQPEFRWTSARREFAIQYARLGRVGEACNAAGLSIETGSYLLKMEPIRDAIAQEVQRHLLTIGETEESVIARWALWANASAADLFKNNWELLPLNEISEKQKRCIKKVKVTATAYGRNVEIEMFDAHKANNDLAIMMGLLGKGDNDTTPPEETARQLQNALKEINNLDGSASVSTHTDAKQPGETPPRLN